MRRFHVFNCTVWFHLEQWYGQINREKKNAYAEWAYMRSGAFAAFVYVSLAFSNEISSALKCKQSKCCYQHLRWSRILKYCNQNSLSFASIKTAFDQNGREISLATKWKKILSRATGIRSRSNPFRNYKYFAIVYLIHVLHFWIEKHFAIKIIPETICSLFFLAFFPRFLLLLLFRSCFFIFSRPDSVLRGESCAAHANESKVGGANAAATAFLWNLCFASNESEGDACASPLNRSNEHIQRPLKQKRFLPMSEEHSDYIAECFDRKIAFSSHTVARRPSDTFEHLFRARGYIFLNHFFCSFRFGFSSNPDAVFPFYKVLNV